MIKVVIHPIELGIIVYKNVIIPACGLIEKI